MKYLVICGSGLIAAAYGLYIAFVVPAASVGVAGYLQSLDAASYLQKCMMSDFIMPDDRQFCASVFAYPVNKKEGKYCPMPATEATASMASAITGDASYKAGSACVFAEHDLRNVHRKLRELNVQVPDFDQWWDAK